MEHSKSPSGGYLLAVALGAAAGGIIVAIATRAVPCIMSRLMSDMMENRMKQMGGEGCDPEEM